MFCKEWKTINNDKKLKLNEVFELFKYVKEKKSRQKYITWWKKNPLKIIQKFVQLSSITNRPSYYNNYVTVEEENENLLQLCICNATYTSISHEQSVFFTTAFSSLSQCSK